jgi:RNase P/RNase MRP subunit p29
MRSRVLVGVLTVVAAAAVGCSNQAVPPAPAPTPAPPTSAPKVAAKGVRGQITAETGSTWTVTNAKGRAFTVTVNGQTAFGTAAAPVTAAQFPVGTTVRVDGSRTGTAVTATRIAPAKSAGATPSASAAPAGLVGI